MPRRLPRPSLAALGPASREISSSSPCCGEEGIDAREHGTEGDVAPEPQNHDAEHNDNATGCLGPPKPSLAGCCGGAPLDGQRWRGGHERQ
jgi:hypothetical protein